MVWRLQLMRQNYTVFEIAMVKKILARRKMIDQICVMKLIKVHEKTSSLNIIGKEVDEIFPLLDPKLEQ